MPSSCRERIRKYDAMAVPVGVTYKGENKFNTLFGGLITLFLVILVGVIASGQAYQVIYNPQYQAYETSDFLASTATEPTVIDSKGTTMALRLSLNYFEIDS